MTGTRLVKMSGSGNDFVVLSGDEAAAAGVDLPEFARRVCRRGLSVGADGLLVVSPEGKDRVKVRFLNPDGREAFCGNGSRCAARFAVERGFAGRSLVLETSLGEIPAEVGNRSVVLVMPCPSGGGRVEIESGGERFAGRSIVAGVPHYVLLVDRLDEAPLDRWGPALRRHPVFGESGANVDLVERTGPSTARLRTWERGVEGETLSCGSGAVAAAFALRLDGGPEAWSLVPRSGIPLRVRLPGPPGAPRAAELDGDARWIFEAVLGDEATSGFPR